jgi:hypothetical protein
LQISNAPNSSIYIFSEKIARDMPILPEDMDLQGCDERMDLCTRKWLEYEGKSAGELCRICKFCTTDMCNGDETDGTDGGNGGGSGLNRHCFSRLVY